MEAATLSAIVVTSPFASMPATTIIGHCISSFDLIEGLENVPVLIVMDGCRVDAKNRMKRGRVTEESLQLYDEYHAALVARFRPPRFRILRSDRHLGFAHAVKLGLEHCNSHYALIAQHDRYFCAPFGRLEALLRAFATHEHIRYIGFPTGNSITHDRFINAEYKLNILNKPNVKLELGESLYLQPLVFWFDSQHLCHVQRYLQIFYPFRNCPPWLREKVGVGAVKDMLLKPGDFIEDKFGQAQRNLLAQLRSDGEADEFVIQAFKWFGSYLCWNNTDNNPFQIEAEGGKSRTLLMVSHLDGRHLDLDKIATYAGTFGMVKNHAFRLLTTEVYQPMESTTCNTPLSFIETTKTTLAAATIAHRPTVEES